MSADTPRFWQQAGQLLNSGQARTLLLTGNIQDLFYLEDERGGDYVPLAQVLAARWQAPDTILVVYETNGPIRFVRSADRDKLHAAWLKWKTGFDADDLAIQTMLRPAQIKTDLKMVAEAFESNLSAAIGNPSVAFELLRQMCLCSRATVGGAPVLRENLVVIIEAADMALPAGDIAQLSGADRHRISICQDWFSEPGYMAADDAVILLAESRSLVHPRIARMPQLLEVAVPAPGEADRLHYINWFAGRLPDPARLRLWSTPADLARLTAGLSIHALRQLLLGACHQNAPLAQADVVRKVESYIQSELGEDIVEFKKPSHTLAQVVGFTRLKTFLRDQLIPRFKAQDEAAIPGAAVCGPIGGGKTFIFEAMAAELDMVVLVLKNIRSQWYGQTDVIFERLRRVLEALAKVLIFVDEADTQFGGVGADTHETERRLTGKIQAMMSDPALRGKVVWLLMTARIHLLSPDIRRPGRVGDLIIPVLDPEGDDQAEFIRWVVKPVLADDLTTDQLAELKDRLAGFFAASYTALRAELKARAQGRKMTYNEVLDVLRDYLPPVIGATRRYQVLQALVNCSRRSLLPDPEVTEEDRERWIMELKKLELQGIS